MIETINLVRTSRQLVNRREPTSEEIAAHGHSCVQGPQDSKDARAISRELTAKKKIRISAIHRRQGCCFAVRRRYQPEFEGTDFVGAEDADAGREEKVIKMRFGLDDAANTRWRK
jgi:hypothetical protein